MSDDLPRTADAVVVGGGTVGAWCAYFLRARACPASRWRRRGCSARARPAGVFVASAGGAGMMWRPAVARAVADLAVSGSTSVVDVSSLGLDRFDESGRSRLAADPIALPFPEKVSLGVLRCPRG